MSSMSEFSRKFDELPDFCTRPELAGFASISVQTLARWAVEGKGPKITRWGGAVRYRKSDIEAWLDSAVA